MIKNDQGNINIYNREDLLKRLKILKNTLSSEKYDEFIALIDGELSPFDKSISNAEAKLYSEFRLYREAVINSLAKRAYEVIRNNPNYEVDYSLSRYTLAFYGKRRTFCYQLVYDSKLSSRYANITSYNAEENDEKVKEHIKFLQSQNSRFINYDYEIRELMKPGLNEDEKILIDVCNPVFNDVMKTYGLNVKDFKNEHNHAPIADQYKQRKNSITLTLEKKYIKKQGE